MTIKRIPTSVRIIWAVGTRGTRVAVIEPAGVEHQALAFMGFGGWLSRFELQRFSLLAELWRMRIVIPEVPGCSSGRTRLSPVQAGALLRGDFRRVSADMVAATEPMWHGGGPDVVLGYSMGASLASAACAACNPDDLPAARLVLVEPVAIRRWTPSALLRATAAEGALAQRFVAETMTWDGAAPPPEDDAPNQPYRQDRLSMTLLGNALRSARLPVDLETGLSRRPGTSVAVVSGTTSLLSRRDDVSALVDGLRRRHVDVADIAVPGSHPLWHSLDRVQNLAARVAASWE